jgi:hypothetical protein
MLDVIEGRFWAIQAFLLDRLRNPNLWCPKAPLWSEAPAVKVNHNCVSLVT